LKKIHHKTGLVEWLKVKALSSSPSTTKKKKKERSAKYMVWEESRRFWGQASKFHLLIFVYSI
jgi:ribosomal protein S21